MSAALPPNPICPSCSGTTTQIPGPAGANGANGTDGAAGENSYTSTTVPFTVPAVGSTVMITVANSGWAVVGQYVAIDVAGFYQVSATPSSTTMTVENTGNAANAAPGVVIANGLKVGPSGVEGPAGSTGVSTLNGISPTTSRGDILVDNGANTPLPSITRFSAGANGTRPMYDATQVAGIRAAAVDLSNTTFTEVTGVLGIANGGSGDPATWPSPVTNNAIVRFDSTAGNIVQNSLLTLDDTGALQSTGGNARGTSSTDLQLVRAAATQVSSGNYAAIVGGSRNTASGAYSGIGGGYGNIALGAYSFAVGRANYAQLDYTFASGWGALSSIYGARSHASGNFVTDGDTSLIDVLWRGTTAAAAAQELFLDGVGELVKPGADGTIVFDILVLGRRDNGDSAAWTFKGAIKQLAASVSLVGSVTGVLLGADAGCAGTWGVLGTVVVDADNVAKSLRIVVTSGVVNNIRWLATGRLLSFGWY